MGVLEQVMELKNQGVPENEIATKLSQRGVSPNEINEAMNQARIKSAVSSEQSMNQSSSQEQNATTVKNQDEQSGSRTKEESPGGMQASIMPREEDESGGEDLPTENISDEDLMPPKPTDPNKFPQIKGPVTHEVNESQKSGKEESSPSYDYSSQYQNYSESEYAPSYQQDNEDYNNYSSSSIGDADTMIEIAEQVFFEKIKPLQKQVESISEFKTLSQVKLDNISERLRRIETHFDRLQTEILRKIGSYGNGIDSIKKEMEMMQDSFGKIVNTVADKAEHRHATSGTASQPLHMAPAQKKVQKKAPLKKTSKTKTKKSLRKKR